MGNTTTDLDRNAHRSPALPSQADEVSADWTERRVAIRKRYDERVNAMLELTRGPRVLHVGACGNMKPKRETMRHFAQAALQEAGFSVLATDINEDGLRWLREEFGCETAYLDAQRIPASGELFDTIFAGELIEHLPSPGLFLAGCAARLKPGGVVVLSTPQPFTLLHVAKYALRYPDGFNPEHTCWFDRQTLEQLLAVCGFRVRRLIFVDDVRAEGRGAGFRAFATLLAVARRLLPARFRTTIVAAAELGDPLRRGGEAARASWTDSAAAAPLGQRAEAASSR